MNKAEIAARAVNPTRMSRSAAEHAVDALFEAGPEALTERRLTRSPRLRE